MQIDFGSNLSYVSKKLVIQQNIPTIKITPLTISLADTTMKQIDEQITSTMTLYDKTPIQPMQLHVIDNCNFDLILGRDFMSANSVDILHSIGEIHIQGIPISHDQNIIFTTEINQKVDHMQHVNKLLSDYSSSIDKYKPILGEKFIIPLKSNTIVSRKPYAVPHHLLEKLKRHLHLLISRNFIRASNSHMQQLVI